MGKLLELFKQQERYQDCIAALEQLKEKERSSLSEYEYAAVLTLIRCLKLRKEIVVRGK